MEGVAPWGLPVWPWLAYCWWLVWCWLLVTVVACLVWLACDGACWLVLCLGLAWVWVGVVGLVAGVSSGWWWVDPWCWWLGCLWLAV